MKDLSRNVSMNCSICGNDQFEYDEEDENTTYKCTNCGKVYTEDELLKMNESKISSSIKDIKSEAVDEARKVLEEMFKKFR